MARIETGSRPGPAQVRPVRAVPQATERAAPEVPGPAQAASHALVVIDGRQRDRAELAERPSAGKPRGGFIAQLLTAGDPTLLPSRLERTRMAAACYEQAARRLA